MPRRSRVALVTGGCKGVGYQIGKEIIKRIPSAITYMTTRGDTAGLSSLIGMELGGGARDRAKFVSMDVIEARSVGKLRDSIHSRFGGLNILVNNAGIYQLPDLSSPENFSIQATELLKTNYWGTKTVLSAFYPDFKQGARIVNITSNLAHVKAKITCEQGELKQQARDKFKKCGSLCELDGLVMKFQRDADMNRCKEEGWPFCAYSVSKMAINAYTRILQRDLDNEGRQDVVVNAVYPATKHSKIAQDGILLQTDETAANFVFYMATIMPNSAGVFPRGEVIWDNSQVVCQDKYLTYNRPSTGPVDTPKYTPLSLQ